MRVIGAGAAGVVRLVMNKKTGRARVVSKPTQVFRVFFSRWGHFCVFFFFACAPFPARNVALKQLRCRYEAARLICTSRGGSRGRGGPAGGKSFESIAICSIANG